MKKLLILVCICVLQIVATPVMADDIFEETFYRKPIFEQLDLQQDGSITPYLVNITKPFDYICRITWDLHFTVASLDYDNFGSNGALTNGTTATYDNIIIVNPIKSIHDFAHSTYNILIQVDEKNPHDVHIAAMTCYSEIIPPYGLKITEGHTFQVQINDNITATGVYFVLLIEGHQNIRIEPDFKRDWLEDAFVFDTPIKLILLPIVFPLAMIFTWEAVGVIVGVGILIIELLIVIGIINRIRWR
jgi:hypothetical protein